MTDFKADGDFTSMDLPGYSVGHAGPVLIISHHPVTTADREGGPQPAVVVAATDDMRPESISRIASLWSHVTNIVLHMNPLAKVYLRGLCQVTLVSCNTKQIAAGHISGAVCVGFLISWLWWSNSSKDRPQARGAGLIYGLGAACGTVLGYRIAGWLAGG